MSAAVLVLMLMLMLMLMRGGCRVPCMSGPPRRTRGLAGAPPLLTLLRALLTLLPWLGRCTEALPQESYFPRTGVDDMFYPKAVT